MRGHDDRESEFFVESNQQIFDPRHVQWVEAREGFVAEQNFGLHHDRPSEGNTPKHPAGQFTRQ